jgi:hypothetical protein
LNFLISLKSCYRDMTAGDSIERRGMKDIDWPAWLVITGLAGGLLLSPIGFERLPAATVPDIRGTWTGSSTGTRNNCQNANDNGTSTMPVTVTISNQPGATFSASGSFTVSASEGDFAVSFSFSGSLTPGGGFTASGLFDSKRVSDNAVGGSGIGHIAGTASRNTLVFSSFDGQTSEGDSCRLSASASLERLTAVPPPIPIPVNPHDVSGDGMADLVWRNTDNTVLAVWLMNGPLMSASGFLGGVPAQWKASGIGDVNGDGKGDIIWNNSHSNVVAVWLMNGLNIRSVGFPGGIAPDWNMGGVGDVDGDGKADLIWRNKTSGVVAIWLMDGTTIMAPGFLGGVPDQCR